VSHNDIVESLFGCFDDWGSCCYGYWCMPCLFGSNAKKIDDKNCVGMCCLYSILASCYACWIPHCFERKALRDKYNLREDPSCGDCLTTAFCGPCAHCQEARELKSRGELEKLNLFYFPKSFFV
jgi:Cys-rich protein (TIGR01571 family)